MRQTTNHAPAGALSGFLGSLPLSAGSVAESLARAATAAAAGGASVAVRLLGAFRGIGREAALAQVSLHLVDHAQRAFERDTTASNTDGRWMVHRAGQKGLEWMDDEQFAVFRDELAARGESLVTLVIRGDTAREVRATLSRYVGGMLHGDTAERPAVIHATPRGGVEMAFFSRGQRVAVPAPEQEPSAPGM